MPVKAHADMLSAQYLAGCRDPSHPCHSLMDGRVHRRPMKHTLPTMHGGLVDTNLQATNGVPDYRKTKRAIHTVCVAETVRAFPPNRVLNAMPPPINVNELPLPRRTRSILAQLRSGHCRRLMSYQHRLNHRVPDLCPLCNHGPHDTLHLFNCPANPIPAAVLDLWNDPPIAAQALSKFLED